MAIGIWMYGMLLERELLDAQFGETQPVASEPVLPLSAKQLPSGKPSLRSRRPTVPYRP